MVRGVVMKVRTRACKTNIEKVRVSRIPAFRPTLSTINSTRLEVTSVSHQKDSTKIQTHPLQLINAPMAPDSRKLNPRNLAVTAHPKNLEKKATTQIRTTYPQVIPLFKAPRLVLRPESAKYYDAISE